MNTKASRRRPSSSASKKRQSRRRKRQAGGGDETPNTTLRIMRMLLAMSPSQMGGVDVVKESLRGLLKHIYIDVSDIKGVMAEYVRKRPLEHTGIETLLDRLNQRTDLRDDVQKDVKSELQKTQSMKELYHQKMSEAVEAIPPGMTQFVVAHCKIVPYQYVILTLRERTVTPHTTPTKPVLIFTYNNIHDRLPYDILFNSERGNDPGGATAEMDPAEVESRLQKHFVDFDKRGGWEIVSTADGVITEMHADTGERRTRRVVTKNVSTP